MKKYKIIIGSYFKPWGIAAFQIFPKETFEFIKVLIWREKSNEHGNQKAPKKIQNIEVFEKDYLAFYHELK